MNPTVPLWKRREDFDGRGAERYELNDTVGLRSVSLYLHQVINTDGEVWMFKSTFKDEFTLKTWILWQTDHSWANLQSFFTDFQLITHEEYYACEICCITSSVALMILMTPSVNTYWAWRLQIHTRKPVLKAWSCGVGKTFNKAGRVWWKVLLFALWYKM